MQEVHKVWAIEKAMEQKNQMLRRKSDVRVCANCTYSCAQHAVLALLREQAVFMSMTWSLFLKTTWMALQASSARQADKQAFMPYYQRALWGLERCWVDNFALEKPWTPQLTGPKALQHRARRVSCRRCNPREWIAGEVRTLARCCPDDLSSTPMCTWHLQERGNLCSLWLDFDWLWRRSRMRRTQRSTGQQ